MQATDKDWVQIQGKFLLNGSATKVVVYLEGPPAGTDILVNTFVIKHAAKTPPSTPPDFEVGLLTFFLQITFISFYTFIVKFKNLTVALMFFCCMDNSICFKQMK